MNALVVEDEIAVGESLKQQLGKMDYFNHIVHKDNFEEGLKTFNLGNFDLVILDIELRNKTFNGLDLCELIRDYDKELPIIVLSAQRSMKFLKRAFELNVNEFIYKPFNQREVELRVRRWINNQISIPRTVDLEYEGLSYSSANNSFYYEDKKIQLTKKSKLLLLEFLKRPERLLTCEFICEKYWGDYGISQKSRNVRSTIQNLRKLLGRDLGEWIVTKRGEGYILKAKIDESFNN